MARSPLPPPPPLTLPQELAATSGVLKAAERRAGELEREREELKARWAACDWLLAGGWLLDWKMARPAVGCLRYSRALHAPAPAAMSPPPTAPPSTTRPPYTVA